MDGTPRALLPITERVMVWVAGQKARLAVWERLAEGQTEALLALQQRRETLRSIELCALAARDIAMFHDLYQPEEGVSRAAAPEVQDQRGAPGGLPSAQGAGCICGSRGGGPCPCPRPRPVR